MQRSTSEQGALLALIGLIVIWAFSWIVMKVVMRYADPFEFAALRYLGGALILFLALILRRQSLKPTALGLTIAVGLCQTTGFQALAQWALVSGGAGNTSLLAYTMPFWVVLLAWLLLGERPGRRQWLGLVLAAGVLVCVVRPWLGFASLTSAFLAMGGGMAWALGVVLSKRMFQRHAPSALSFTAWQMLIGSLVIGVIALAVPSPPIEWTPQFWLGLVYSIVLASSLAWLLWQFVVQRLPTTVAGLSSLGVPITAVLLAWIILEEQPTMVERVGILLIAAGLIAVSGIGPRRRQAEPQAGTD